MKVSLENNMGSGENLFVINEFFNLAKNYVVLSHLYDESDVDDAINYYVKDGNNFLEIFEYLKFNMGRSLVEESLNKRELTNEAEFCDIFEKCITLTHNTMIFNKKYAPLLEIAVAEEPGHFYKGLIRLNEILNGLDNGTFVDIEDTFNDSPLAILYEEDRLYSQIIDRILSENKIDSNESYYKLYDICSSFDVSRDIELLTRYLNEKLIDSKDFDKISEDVYSMVFDSYTVLKDLILNNVAITKFFDAYKNLFVFQPRFIFESEVRNIISSENISEDMIKKFISIFLASFIDEADCNKEKIKVLLEVLKEDIDGLSPEIKTIIFMNINEIVDSQPEKYQSILIQIGLYIGNILTSVIPQEEEEEYE